MNINIKYITILCATMTLLSACNTIKGAGEDLEAAGNWIVKGVNDAEKHTKPTPKGKYQYPGENKPSHIDR